MRADTLLDYITERGGKLYLTWKHYRALQRLRLYPHAVDAAVETLYADGAIDVRLAGNTPVLEVVEAR